MIASVGIEKLVALLEEGFGRATVPAGLRERYRGALLGVAAGNALGLPAEGLTREALRRRFPGGLRDVRPEERDRPWDDDVAQTVALAEALLAWDELDLEDLAARLVRWARENGRGMGYLTARVLAQLASGTPAEQAARVVWERGGRRQAGNGAVMRCAPVALRWRRSARHLVEEARKSALVTHADPRCEWSAVVTVAAVAAALEGSPLHLGRLAGALLDAGAPDTVGDAVRSVPGGRVEDLALDDPAAMGYTLKAMQVALWCLEREPDFEAALVEVVNAGGDTDTNGAVAGAVMGGRAGAGGITRHWLESVPGADRLVALADELLAASER